MMARVRWRSMYLLSCAVGYAMAGALWLLGQRWSESVTVMVTQVARGHAEDAEHQIGPYLAPVTALAFLVMLVAVILIAVLG